MGADPEFVIYNEGHLLLFNNRGRDPYVPWGIDHGGYVIEPHPKPELSVRALIANLKTSFNDFATVSPNGKWRAGAYLATPERPITLGGHVHIDRPRPTNDEVAGLDLVTKHLEALDILPATECVERRNNAHGYGKYGDIRVEHGHFEYRTMASWLFSQRVTKLCLLASKLVMVDPAAPGETLGKTTTYASLAKLKAFFERFKGKDDDVDWILDAGLFDRKLNVKPDRDLKDVWAVTPKKEKPHWKAMQEQQRVVPAQVGNQEQQRVVPAQVGNQDFYCYSAAGTVFYNENGGPLTQAELVALPAPIVRRLAVDDTWHTITGNIIRKIADLNLAWPDTVPTKTVRNTVHGVEYLWRVHERQDMTLEMFATLRRCVVGGLARPYLGVRLVEGLAVEYIRTRGGRDMFNAF